MSRSAPVSAMAPIEAAVASSLDVLLSSGTQADKTTLLNCLAAEIPAMSGVLTSEECSNSASGSDVVGSPCRTLALGRLVVLR
jgi:Flp pilus assembly CpaF family ATPase